MNLISFFLARRILLSSFYQKGISTMAVISFIGIFIGSFSLALITAITHGYEYTIKNKMQGIHSQITIRASQPLNMLTLEPVLKNEFPEIIQYSPTTARHILIRPINSEQTPDVAIVKGIDPQKEMYTTVLSQKITAPLITQEEFPTLFKKNQILIGQQMASCNELAVGDEVELLYNSSDAVHGRKVTFQSHRVIVGGIFKTGIDEFDSNLIYCSFFLLEELFPDVEVEQIAVQLHEYADETKTITALKKRLGVDVYSWKDLYPSLCAALMLEKYVTFFILALITLVASMNIISLLFMHITQKRPDIAILAAMGMSHTTINHIFFYIGMIISVIASTCGLCAAVIASWLLDAYPFIQLPDAYYVTTLPVHMTWQIIVTVFCLVLFFSFFATWLPIRRIKHINISEVLRFEG